MTIIDAISDEHLLKPLFKNLSTWKAWICALKVIFGLSLNDDELALYKQCTGREKPPTKPFKEIYLICGRRSGKSFIASLIACYLALFYDYSPYLGPGERATVMVLAVDRKQAQVILRYVKGIFSLPLFKNYVQNERAEGIELSNRVDIEIKTSSYRGTRGFSVAVGILEETSFWRSGDSANPDFEIYRAIKPAMATIANSMLISITTPYSKAGLVYEAYREYWGKEDESVLVWKSPSALMNPTLSEKMIEKELSKDPSAAKAEWLSEFREDIEQFLPLEVIDAVVIPGRVELPPIEKTSYFSFVDPSGGGGDAFALSIGHKENSKVVQDVLRARKGDPHEIVKEYSELLKKYGIKETVGDRYSAAWCSTAFETEGIRYKASGLNKSELYLEALPYISARVVELVDNRDLIRELRLLERRRGSSGKDTVSHPTSMGGGVPHDDLANVTCGMIAIAFESRAQPGLFVTGTQSVRAEGPQVAERTVENLTERGRRFFMGE